MKEIIAIIFWIIMISSSIHVFQSEGLFMGIIWLMVGGAVITLFMAIIFMALDAIFGGKDKI